VVIQNATCNPSAQPQPHQFEETEILYPSLRQHYVCEMFRSALISVESQLTTLHHRLQSFTPTTHPSSYRCSPLPRRPTLQKSSPPNPQAHNPRVSLSFLTAQLGNYQSFLLRAPSNLLPFELLEPVQQHTKASSSDGGVSTSGPSTLLLMRQLPFLRILHHRSLPETALNFIQQCFHPASKDGG
jgi:hypothetical protein